MAVGDGAITIADLSYTAGIIDGEGSIMIKRSKGNRPNRPTPEYRVVISVTNTNRLLLEWLFKKFGGSIKHYAKQAFGHKPCYTWTITAKSGIIFLRLIKPYVLLKGEQLETALLFQTSVGGQPRLSTETLMFREECFQKARELNKRGVL